MTNSRRGMIQTSLLDELSCHAVTITFEGQLKQWQKKMQHEWPVSTEFLESESSLFFTEPYNYGIFHPVVFRRLSLGQKKDTSPVCEIFIIASLCLDSHIPLKCGQVGPVRDFFEVHH